MDHLPWGDQLPRGRPVVPFLCADSKDDICDNIDEFGSWPTVKGWDLTSPTVSEAAQWCQAWLFFGFLRILTESLGRTFSVEAYVSDRNSNVLDPRPVTELSTTVRRKLFIISSYNPFRRASSSPFARNIYMVLEETLHVHSTWIIRTLQEYEAQHQTHDPWTLELFNVFWSALLLFEMFCDLGHGLQYNENVNGIYSALPALTRSTRTLKGALLTFGRCPTVLNRIDLSPMKVFNLMTIPVFGNADHTQCRNWHCRALDVDSHNYQTQHDEQCRGRCPIVRISLQCLENIIESNSIPLVRSTIDISGTLTVDIVDSTAVEDYVAVSHIWAKASGTSTKMRTLIASCTWIYLVRKRPCIIDLEDTYTTG